jgi:AcrR family transcriptional regulator
MEDKQRKSQKRTIESKEKIKRASYELFCKQGLYHTNTKEIAKLAQVSVGNFYNYYQNKEEIYFEMVEEYLLQSEEALRNLVEDMLDKKQEAKDIVVEKFVKYMDQQMERAVRVNMFFSDNHLAKEHNAENKQRQLESKNRILEQITFFLQSYPYICKRAEIPVMAYLVFTIADQISISIMMKRDAHYYEELKDELTKILIQYIFDVDWKR